MGSPKQLIVHQGQPLVRRAALAAIDAGATPTVVVLGANADLITSALLDLPSVITVVNEQWQSGLASSLATGLRTLLQLAACDAVLVTLADQPLVDTAALSRLIAAFDTKHSIVTAAYDDTVGVPAVFAREYVDELMQLTGDVGAGPWLRSQQHYVTRVPLGVAALDVDTPSDAARLNEDASDVD